jgi:hypothetical protein
MSSVGIRQAVGWGGDPGASAGESGVKCVDGDVGVIERTATVGEQLVDERDARGVGMGVVLEVIGDLEQVAPHAGDAVWEDGAAIEPMRRL